MDEEVPTSTGKQKSSEIELQASKDGTNGKVAESGQQQKTGSSNPSGSAWSRVAVKSLSKKMTRKEQRLESWALTEAGPTPCNRGCSFCCWNGSLDSVGCPLASHNDVYEILHHSRLVLGAYGTDIDDLEKLIKEQDPKFSKKIVVRLEHPSVNHENCPPFFISVDEERQEVGLYMRGLNLLCKDDYIALMSNKKHEKEFQGGYMHEGMANAAEWCLAHIVPDLKKQLLEHEGYRLTMVGHSLGAGVCSLLGAIVLEDRDLVGGIDPHLIRVYAIAPPRVLSLPLAKNYAPNIYSVIYQDDFLARISTSSVKKVFIAAFALTGVVLFLYWLTQEMKKRPASDVYRLYPPGRIFHVVYRQPGVSHEMPIQVRVIDSVEGRFERIIMTSSGSGTDHSVLKLSKHLKSYDWPPEFRHKI